MNECFEINLDDRPDVIARTNTLEPDAGPQAIAVHTAIGRAGADFRRQLARLRDDRGLRSIERGEKIQALGKVTLSEIENARARAGAGISERNSEILGTTARSMLGYVRGECEGGRRW